MDDRPVRMPKTAEVVQAPPRRQAKPADPCAMVIFGATGDLTKRLVIPALYNLSRTKMLPEHFALIGVARAEGTTESWRDQLYDTLKSFVGNATTEFDVEQIDEAAWKRLAQKMVYVRGDLNKPELYDKLRSALEEADKARGKTFYNFEEQPYMSDELPGYSVFTKDEAGQIFHTYSVFARGTEDVGTVYGFLDITPKGRNEPPGTNLSDWVRHHDKYDEKVGDSRCHG